MSLYFEHPIVTKLKANINVMWSDQLREIQDIVRKELEDRQIPPGYRDDCMCIGCTSYRKTKGISPGTV